MAKRDPALLLLTLVIFFTAASSLSEQELDAALAALRERGYSLFGNAVTASDIRLELLRVPNGSYTFFAPTDEALFALDMASPASFYVRSLRRHIVLRRLPIHLLGVLPSGYLLPTLLPKRSLCISRRLTDGYITADNVEVVLPGVFHGRDLVAHGLDGILPPRHPADVYSRADPHPRSPDLTDPPSRSTNSANPPPRSADPPALWAPMVSPAPGIEFPTGSPLLPLLNRSCRCGDWRHLRVRSRRSLGLCVAVSAQDVAFLRGETERSEHRRPALARDDAHRAAAFEAKVRLPVEEKQHYVVGARAQLQQRAPAVTQRRPVLQRPFDVGSPRAGEPS
ncbi:hypothetical protein J5N97_012340 [Dioscorea zingiberensis]|uniref:FAS1 domain-containing protein n=1 Tax=Dioscorea zingiberensis TaxID=325984 RepID=A0A9D5CNS9_9LILI|nr:hypothetical protein J5N97_012340 [Dioscorea zingiberensis]